MKYSATSAAIILAVSAIMTGMANGQHDHTCDECKLGAAALGAYLQTEAEIEITQEALANLVCTTLEEDNVQGCNDFIRENWAAMVTGIFAYPDTTIDICVGMGYCENKSPKV